MRARREDAGTGAALVRIGCEPIVMRARWRTPALRNALVLAASLFASMAPAVRAPATLHTEANAREREDLQEQVVRLFDQLDHVRRAIENVRADTAWVRERISKLSREVGAQQRVMNRRAAEAYMAGASGVDSVLGARSFSDLQDTLEFLGAISRSDHDLLLSLEHRKAQIDLQRDRLEALEVELQGTQERLKAAVANLIETLRRQHALLGEGAEGTAPDASVDTVPSPPAPGPPPPGSALGRRAVTDLIRDRFASLGSRTVEVALCVAERESGLDPSAVNPATGAAGLFQFLPSTWASLSELAGFGAASVFDAGANAAVSAWTVARYGWHPWRSVAADCRA
jgi:Transglycosylase SLT domain